MHSNAEALIREAMNESRHIFLKSVSKQELEAFDTDKVEAVGKSRRYRGQMRQHAAAWLCSPAC